jgi:uncharacterized protein (DUF1501 family)
MNKNRRDFLVQGLATTSLVSFGAAAPNFLQQAALAAEDGKTQRVLLVVQLSGGNDGLNTVVPYKQPIYRQARPTLAVPAADVLSISDELGLHPALGGLNDLLDDNQLAIIQGVGYPNPNRSHFESMDIWHSCQRKTEVREQGWLGRYLEASLPAAEGAMPGLHLGREKQPLALRSRRVQVPSVQSLDQFRLLTGGQDSSGKSLESLASRKPESRDDLLDFVADSTRSAVAASRQLAEAARGKASGVTYPETALASKLQVVASLIDSPLMTRIFYVTLDGFDTHARQQGAHASLLGQLNGAMAAFASDLRARDQADRVLTLCFSEFGRRLKENASEGTDHGAAAPLLLIGPAVRAGLHGELPSLEDLDQGDLKYHTDFRSVYSTVLENWLQSKSRPVLGADFQPLPLLDV